MDIENKPEEIQVTPTENNVEAVSEQKETPEQINWKKFREAREVERKQKIEAEKRAAEKEQEALALKAAMEAILSKQPASQNTYVDEQDISEEEKIRKQVEAVIAERDRKYEAERLQREQAELPRRLESLCPNFNQVCSEENVDYLEYHHKSLAKAFSLMPDGLEKWQAIYEAVKKLVPNVDSKKDQAKAEKNFLKPQSMSVAGKTQTGDHAPHHLDDKRRADNWARMMRVMKGG